MASGIDTCLGNDVPSLVDLALQKAYCILMSKARSASRGLQLPKASLCIRAFNRAVRVFTEEYFVNENAPRHYRASAGEMAYQVKALATKAHNLSSNLDSMEGGGNRLPQVGL